MARPGISTKNTEKIPRPRNSGLPYFTLKIHRKYRKNTPKIPKMPILGIFGVFSWGPDFRPRGYFVGIFVEIPGRAISGLCSRSFSNLDSQQGAHTRIMWHTTGPQAHTSRCIQAALLRMQDVLLSKWITSGLLMPAAQAALQHFPKDLADVPCLDSASEAGLFWKRGLCRKVHSLQDQEYSEILEIPDSPQIRKVWLSIKFVSAKFGLNPPPPNRAPNKEKLYKSV